MDNKLILVNPDNPNGPKVTTSLLIAVKFHKSHGKVLRDIANLSCSQEFMQANFGLHEYKDSRGNTQPMYYITKDGFSFLVLGYNGKDAGKFKEEYIKAFNEGQDAIKVLDNDDTILARAFEILAERQKKLEIQLKQKDEQLAISEKIIKESAPKVKYHDEVLQSKNGHPISIIAEELGMSAIKLNRLLVKFGVQRKVGGTYILCNKYLNKGYTSSYTHVHINEYGVEKSKILTTWTESGRKMIMNFIDDYNKSSLIF